MAHEIRLAGPWELSSDAGDTWQRCTLPLTADASEAATEGQIQLQRKFHRPTGLEQTSQVVLRFEAGSQPAAASVNEQPLTQIRPATEHDTFDIDVTSHLLSFNTLIFQATQSWAASLRNVRLRIVES